MRSTWIVLWCALVFPLIAPASADAWWEYIEGLSGPKLHGPHFEARLFCFMQERSKPDSDLLEKYRPKDPPPIVGTQGAPQKTDAQSQPRAFFFGVTLPCIFKNHSGDTYRRHLSLDVGFRYHWDGSFEPAGDHKVHFVTLTPYLTWYPVKRPTRDVIDLSAGLGVYRFFSCAFPSFGGGFMDLRADVHVPTVIRRLSKWTFLIPTGRVGIMVFPSGFKRNAFADTEDGLTSKFMDGPEPGRYVGFFFDLDALLLENTVR